MAKFFDIQSGLKRKNSKKQLQTAKKRRSLKRVLISPEIKTNLNKVTCSYFLQGLKPLASVATVKFIPLVN